MKWPKLGRTTAPVEQTWWKRLRYILALLALCSIATCPIAKRSCTNKGRAREADELLDYLANRVADAVVQTGKVPPASTKAVSKACATSLAVRPRFMPTGGRSKGVIAGH